MSKFALSTRSQANRSKADPRLIEMSDIAISISPVDFGHSRLASARNTEQQNRLFLDGFSKCDGYDKLSYHQVRDSIHPDLPELSRALDFFAYVNGRAIWKGKPMAIVACSFLQAACQLGYKAEWGGLWPWDYPHIQLID